MGLQELQRSEHVLVLENPVNSYEHSYSGKAMLDITKERIYPDDRK